jgi:putative phosphoribosyl transferase
VINEDVVSLAGMTANDIAAGSRRELAEIERRRQVYLQNRRRVPLAGKTLILVDDGIATGATVRAALKALRRRNPKALILAVPVAPPDTVADLDPEVDDLICLATPEPFFAIGNHYRNFAQLSDAEVVELLASARGLEDVPSGDALGSATEAAMKPRQKGDRQT